MNKKVPISTQPYNLKFSNFNSKGTCIDQVDKYKCLCRDGFSGPTCQINTNPCLANRTLCGSYGTCYPLYVNSTNLSYQCKCLKGFKGENCHIPISRCELYSPCLNGATCIDTALNAFRCNCPSNLTGSYCERRVDPCMKRSNLCNTGKCINQKSTGMDFTCFCPASHSGMFCQNIVNSCEPNPCVENQGFCQQLTLKDGSKSFQCLCVNGLFILTFLNYTLILSCIISKISIFFSIYTISK